MQELELGVRNVWILILALSHHSVHSSELHIFHLYRGRDIRPIELAIIRIKGNTAAEESQAQHMSAKLESSVTFDGQIQG